MTNTEKLRTARGPEWVRLIRVVFDDVAPRLAADAKAILDATGALTAMDVLRLSKKHDIIPKYAFEWLEEKAVLPTGTYQKLRDRGFKPMKALEEIG